MGGEPVEFISLLKNVFGEHKGEPVYFSPACEFWVTASEEDTGVSLP